MVVPVCVVAVTVVGVVAVVESIFVLVVVVLLALSIVVVAVTDDVVNCSGEVMIDPVVVAVLMVQIVSYDPVSMVESSAEDRVDPVATSRVFWATVKAASTSAAAWTSASSAEARAAASSARQVTVLLTISLLRVAIRGLKV